LAKGDHTILLVSHEATRTGAAIFFLQLARWIAAESSYRVRIVTQAGGPLLDSFRAVAPTCCLDREQIPGDWLDDLALVYVNTSRGGHLLNDLARFGVPVISHIHELAHEFSRAGVASVVGLLNHTSRFIACSESVSAFLRATCELSDEQVSVIHEMVPIASVRERADNMSPREVREYLGVPAEAVLIGASGVASWRKGTDLFLQIADRFQRAGVEEGGVDCRFIWIGNLEGSDRSDEYLHDREQLGLSERVIFVGEQENPYPFIRALDLFCLPSREDPFPLVMLEAGALGKPTVAFAGSGGAEEYCGLGGGVTVPHMDTDAMAQELARQAGEMYRAERVEAGERAKVLVEENFGVGSVAPKIMALVAQEMQEDIPEHDPIEQAMMAARAAKGLSAPSRVQVVGRVFSKWEGTDETRCEREFRADGNGLVELRILIRVPPGASRFRLRIEPSDRPAIVRVMQLRMGEGDEEGPGGRRDFLGDMRDGLTFSDSMMRLGKDEGGVTLLAVGRDSRIYTPNMEVRGLPERFEVAIAFFVDCDLARRLPSFIEGAAEMREGEGHESYWRRALASLGK
jgi:glycosyltransferase involved in cell wall biosynthesis